MKSSSVASFAMSLLRDCIRSPLACGKSNQVMLLLNRTLVIRSSRGDRQKEVKLASTADARRKGGGFEFGGGDSPKALACDDAKRPMQTEVKTQSAALFFDKLFVLKLKGLDLWSVELSNNVEVAFDIQSIPLEENKGAKSGRSCGTNKLFRIRVCIGSGRSKIALWYPNSCNVSAYCPLWHTARAFGIKGVQHMIRAA